MRAVREAIERLADDLARLVVQGVHEDLGALVGSVDPPAPRPRRRRKRRATKTKRTPEQRSGPTLPTTGVSGEATTILHSGGLEAAAPRRAARAEPEEEYDPELEWG